MPVVALVDMGFVASAQSVAESTAKVGRLDLWDVEITKMGTHCIIDPDHVRLRRAVAGKAAKLRISGPANSPSAIVEFAADATVAPIDAATFPIADGSSMTVSDPSYGTTIGQIDFAILASGPDDPKKLVEALKTRGCAAQLELVTSP